MKKQILTGSLLLLLLTAMADIPGYMGLKLVVKYDAGLFHPGILGRTGTLPSLQNNLSVECAVSRAWMVGVRYGFMTYNHSPNPNTFYPNTRYKWGINSEDYKGRLTQHVVSVYAKKFPYKKGFIAPHGRYFLIGMYYQYATDYDSRLDTYSDGRKIVTTQKATAHFGGLMLGTGRNFILANRVVIDFGFVINVPLAIFPKTEYIEFNKNIMLRNLLQINLGLGVLAF